MYEAEELSLSTAASGKSFAIVVCRNFRIMLYYLCERTATKTTTPLPLSQYSLSRQTSVVERKEKKNASYFHVIYNHQSQQYQGESYM